MNIHISNAFVQELKAMVLTIAPGIVGAWMGTKLAEKVL